MTDSPSNPVPTPGPSEEDLLSLAWDCTEMVTALSKGYEVERDGERDDGRSN